MSEPKEQEAYFKHNKSLDKGSPLHTSRLVVCFGKTAVCASFRISRVSMLAVIYEV